MGSSRSLRSAASTCSVVMPGGCGKLAISRRIITLSTNEHSAACAEDSTDPIAERTMDQDPAQPEIDMCPVTLPNFYRTGKPDAERTPREAKSASESDPYWITLPRFLQNHESTLRFPFRQDQDDIQTKPKNRSMGSATTPAPPPPPPQSQQPPMRQRKPQRRLPPLRPPSASKKAPSLGHREVGAGAEAEARAHPPPSRWRRRRCPPSPQSASI